MGREVRRVPLDFNWPIDKTWDGFLNNMPEPDPCPACRNPRDDHSTGYSPFAAEQNAKWYGFYGVFDAVAEGKAHMKFTPESPPIRAFAERQIKQTPEYYGRGEEAIQREARRLCDLANASGSNFLDQADVDALVRGGRLTEFTHHWLPRVEDGNGGWTGGWTPNDPPTHPTAEQVNNWSAGPGMGHDSINQWVVIKDRCERAGVSSTCAKCEGEGVIWASSLQKERYEGWEPTPPPEGEGYQIWQTVSEGSPISPVFATPEELARHMTKTRWGADDGTSYETWLKFIKGPGWAPSMMTDSRGVLVSGVEAIAGKTSLEDIFSDIDQ